MTSKMTMAALAALILLSTAVNLFAAIKLNRAYDKVADIFCVEAPQ